ncbi:S-adenosylmethionine decarboxylase [Jatrophihabitans endophyticus]|uniref:S-adenosylmethionine decarboxylase n=1 Tax=Jatrophihabitans endophyticus TaxID=1206085 RepID=A0A1M5RXC9_9ACTN|nr:S-adenosylmethionine decarboxylase [Jatrophihabitans endophyticus]SHH30453.1 S-adenosylmethionine decarboxylase [Jatrophihabitans endophyticus]
MRDLAPEIHRQRLVIEGVPRQPVVASQITSYLQELTGVLQMQPLMVPVTHSSPKFGWAGWIHWETSGAHFYAWDVPKLFFSVDIYTCKPFVAQDAVDFTAKTFEASIVEFKEF